MLTFVILASLAMVSGSPLLPPEERVWSEVENSEVTTVPRNPAEYRLPTTTRPISYDINLVVDPEATEFTGKTRVTIFVASSTDIVVMHSLKLNVTRAQYRLQGGATWIDVEVFENTTNDKHFLTINTTTNLIQNQTYELQFEYKAPYGSLEGLYKSSYVINGTRRMLATTQFQPTFARSVFPCYDEPALKATFDIHIQAPPDYFVISNMDKINSTVIPEVGFNVTSFKTIPKMSTYLLAFVISDFDYKSNYVDGPVHFFKEYRVYARPDAKDTTDYALDIGQRTFQYLQSYTDVGYRLPKLDNIAIPDFKAGAMENWGLITYKEDYLLNLEGVTTSERQMFISTIMSHENAHFWFGDEVSPEWWGYTWLNEGFATFFEYYASDIVYMGERRVMEQFVVIDVQNVMIEDATPTTNPMTSIVGSPDEIRRNFNGIAYPKSGAVIRMIQHTFGDAPFRHGLSNYLKSLPMGVAEPTKLFDSLQETVIRTKLLPENITVNNIFGSWSNQAGYPVLNVARVANGTTINVQQERFFMNSNTSSNNSWWVPLTWVVSSNPDFSKTLVQSWLRPNQKLELPIDGKEEWFIFNKQQMGYYRVMYDIASWRVLAKTLNTEKRSHIHPLNRAQLIDDSGVFSRTGRLHYNITLDILSSLRWETDWIPWISANRVINLLNPLMKATKLEKNLYDMFIRDISSGAFDKYGIFIDKGDSYVTKRMKSLISSIACRSDNIECTSRAFFALSNAVTGSQTKVHPDVQSTVYCYGLKRTENDTFWNLLFSKYYDSPYESEKSTILNALGCVPNDNITLSYLQKTLMNANESNIRVQDKETVLRSVINAGKISMSIQFLDQNYAALNKSMNTVDDLPKVISSLGNNIVLPQDIDSFNKFSEKYNANFSTAEKNAVTSAKQSIQANSDWINKHMVTIDAWLTDYHSGSKGIRPSFYLLVITLILYFKPW